MNHDDKTSKPTPNPEMEAWIAPELEARVVAWIAGEASAFEIAELERLVAEKPELAIFKRRIEAVQGLVVESVRPDKTPLRMANDRRAKLLATIGATTNVEAATPGGRIVALPATRKRSRWWWPGRQGYVALSSMAAACLVALLFLPRHKVPVDMAVARSGSDRGMVRSDDLAASIASGGRPSAPSRKGASSEEAPVLALSMPEPPKPPPSATMGSSRVSSPQMAPASTASTPPADARADGSTAQESIQLSPFVVQQEPSFFSRAKKLLSGRQESSGGRGGQESKVPQRPDPEILALGGTNPSPTAAPAGGDVTGRPNAPVDPIVKLDAFSVSASEDLGYAATVTTSGTLILNQKPRLESNVAADGLRATFGQSIVSGSNANKPTDQSIVLGASSAGGTLSVASDKKSVVASAVIDGEAQAGSKELLKSLPADLPLPRAQPASSAVDESLRAEVTATAQPASTFSLHVSDVSFRLAQAALARGESLEPARIRPEEFYNAFDYGDPMPTVAEKIAARIEQSAHPFLQQRNLVRIAMRVGATGRGQGQPLRLTVLLDTSGSMERDDRAASVRRALQELIALLGPDDRITLIGFARQTRLFAENVPGNQAGGLVDLIARTPAEGGTNLEEALKLGGELARRHLLPAAQNRIVLLTDGAANLGNADPEQLGRSIESLRQQGLAFDACGVGLDGLDDAVLEALTRRGDGRYYVLNSPDDATAGFARKLAGALRPAAENVKLQVRFNPARVGHYRLIGFEQHRLRAEDFRNDKVDAAELAAEEAAVALYQVEVLPQGEGEMGEVFVRFRDAASGQMVERSWTIPYDATARSFDRATPSLQLAGAAAFLAEKLRGGAAAEPIKLRDLAMVVNALRGHYVNEPRAQEFVTMFAQARRLQGD